MITAEVRLNGTLIGFLYIKRLEEIENEKIACDYHVEYYEPGKKTVKFKMEHVPIMGLLSLLENAIINTRYTRQQEQKGGEK